MNKANAPVKKIENRLRINRVTAMSLVFPFWNTACMQYNMFSIQCTTYTVSSREGIARECRAAGPFWPKDRLHTARHDVVLALSNTWRAGTVA